MPPLCDVVILTCGLQSPCGRVRDSVEIHTCSRTCERLGLEVAHSTSTHIPLARTSHMTPSWLQSVVGNAVLCMPRKERRTRSSEYYSLLSQCFFKPIILTDYHT